MALETSEKLMGAEVNVQTGSLRKSIRVEQKATISALRKLIKGRINYAKFSLAYGGKDYTGEKIAATGRQGRFVYYVEPQELHNPVLIRAMQLFEYLYNR